MNEVLDLSAEDTEALEAARAYRMVALRGRAHKIGGGHISVHVHTTTIREAELLKRHVGGNYYKHGTGFLWQCASAEGRKRCLEAIAAHLPADGRRRFAVWPEATALLPMPV